MASARVGSPIVSCHFSTGNWLVAKVRSYSKYLCFLIYSFNYLLGCNRIIF